MDAIPKSLSGKILRRLLRDQAKADAEAEQQKQQQEEEGGEKIKAKL